MRHPLPVQPRGSILMLRRGLVGFFVLMAIAVAASRGFALESVGLALLLLALAAVMFGLFRNAGRRTAVVLDQDGLTRGDGRRLAWRDLIGLENQLALSRRHQHEILWRVTLHFAGDEAWVIPAQTANLDDLLLLLDAMPVPKRDRPV